MDVGYGASSATSAAAAPSTPQASMPHRWPVRLFQTERPSIKRLSESIFEPSPVHHLSINGPHNTIGYPRHPSLTGRPILLPGQRKAS